MWASLSGFFASMTAITAGLAMLTKKTSASGSNTVHRVRPGTAISARTVRAVLEDLERSQPVLYRNVCDETGAVRRHLNVFVNSDNVRDLNGVDTTLAPGDVVTILPAVSGG